MKKLSLIACMLLSLGITGLYAQHSVNNFFDELGETRIQTLEYSEAADTIVTTFHRMDDILWSKVVYRIIDLRYKQNYQLYFPQKVNDPDYKNLFRVILEAIEDGVEVYDMIDLYDNIKPDYSQPINGSLLAERMTSSDYTYKDNEDVETNMLSKLNAQVLQYDTITDKYKFNNNATTFQNVSKDQIKYMIREIVFFDRHTSRLHTSILAIAPLRSDRIQEKIDEEDSKATRCDKITRSLYQSFTCWIPFLKLRPYLIQQYAIPIENETRRVTFDEFFQKHLYSSYLLGEDNLYTRMIPEYCATPEEAKKEQERIEKEMLDFEQDLWAY